MRNRLISLHFLERKNKQKQDKTKHELYAIIGLEQGKPQKVPLFTLSVGIFWDVRSLEDSSPQTRDGGLSFDSSLGHPSSRSQREDGMELDMFKYTCIGHKNDPKRESDLVQNKSISRKLTQPQCFKI